MTHNIPSRPERIEMSWANEFWQLRQRENRQWTWTIALLSAIFTSEVIRWLLGGF